MREQVDNTNLTDKERLNAKVEALGKAMKSATEKHFEKKDPKSPDTTRSKRTTTPKNGGNYVEAKRTTYKIRRRIQKERCDTDIR